MVDGGLADEYERTRGDGDDDKDGQCDGVERRQQ